MKSPILHAWLPFLACCTLSTGAEISLSGLFSDHMVLQRGKKIPVWGTATPNMEVTVSFAGQTKSARTDDKGRWLVNLDDLEPRSSGSELVASLSDGSRSTKITDVLVGDVWLCSGQSNMHFRMKSVENADTEIAAMRNPSIRYFNVKQQFGQTPIEEIEGEWKAISPETAADCSAVAGYFALALQQKIDVPIGLLNSSVGGTRIESWIRAETLAATGESQNLVEKWKAVSPGEFKEIGQAYAMFQYQRDQAHPKAVQVAREKGEPIPPAPVAPRLRCHDCPSALHNGMIAPLERFPIRGVIWYQGESNAGAPASYETLLPALIYDWRVVWGKEWDLPFLFVQIAPHKSIHPSFREAQHRIWRRTPNTAMIVTTDAGNMDNIHPTAKRPVGERLALAARALAYGEELVSSGPEFTSMVTEAKRAVLSFKNTGSGLVAKGGELKGFSLAGEDGKFMPATAVIQGDTVIVSSAKVERPTTVRYNWAMNPEGNLFNKEGLPALPFRSDAPALW